MDYNRNFDLLHHGQNAPTISGTQYRVIDDLVAEPVSVEFFKEHARIDFDTDDTLCEAYIKAGRLELERWTQLSFGEKVIGFTAKRIPDGYRLMNGPVDEITYGDFENIGDILEKGGEDVVLQFSTLPTYFEDAMVRVAICRYAAGLYAWRENMVESKYRRDGIYDEAKEMLLPIKNIIIF